MTGSREPYEAGRVVIHSRHGSGRVIIDMGPTVIVRFDGAVEQVLADELVAGPSLTVSLIAKEFGDPLDAITRAQSLAVKSVNDQWGVFSRSRVQLLPHQLWVCQKVNRHWPFRWLVADDVGLGKTIECGLVLMPLIASGRVKRVLILAPAKLVPQWQYRLKDMFDIRLQRYVSEADNQRGDFWQTASMVVASFHTLRNDRRGARQRLIDAEPWDLVIVDEAHHLGVDERNGETLAYSLVSDLEERKKINSLLFFTGTPHRGKDYGFFGLMHLVRPDLFDPEGDMRQQLSHLSNVMIRTNKAYATDLQGNKLFKPISVFNREYSYSEAESLFYRTLSEFILDGRAYAGTLDGRAQSARMLVLVTLQKLAASSIAAIRNALQKRQSTLSAIVSGTGSTSAPILPDDEQATLDDIAEAEESLPGAVAALLMEDEIARIGELLGLADAILVETKIERLMSMLDTELAEEPVLLFTEYKATQALVVNALQRRFGSGCVSFINGDERLDGVEDRTGRRQSITSPREHAADAFNTGAVRFLVSTEAGGEGIDLQERCATLVHVDMPWNPMRLHQRVGRLSRYGQKRPVSVFILRNPATVEARIWDLLNAKLERIQVVLSSVMEEQEDIAQLVIGMAGGTMFNDLFAGAQGVAEDRLDAWFDRSTATLGGKDVVETVRELLGNVARFDFQQVGRDLPKVDLPDLENFFSNAVSRHGRRVFRRSDGIEIKTPDIWKSKDYAVREKYEGLSFDRTLRGELAATRVIGVGHRLFDTAMDDALGIRTTTAPVEGLQHPFLVLSVEDEVTGTGASVNRVVLAVTEETGALVVLRDWELLVRLNRFSIRSGVAPQLLNGERAEVIVERFRSFLGSQLNGHVPAMVRPVAWPEMLLVPGVFAGATE